MIAAGSFVVEGDLGERYLVVLPIEVVDVR
jgi:hypothetical protein